MKDQRIIKIKTYRGEELVYGSNGEVKNETNVISLEDGRTFHKFIKHLASDYICKAEVVDVHLAQGGEVDNIRGVKAKGKSLRQEEWKSYIDALYQSFDAKRFEKTENKNPDLTALEKKVAELEAKLSNTASNDSGNIGTPDESWNIKQLRAYIKEKGYDIKGTSTEALLEGIRAEEV